MSSRHVSVSSVLDRLEAWGDPPVVNPIKSKDRTSAARPQEPTQSPGRFAGLALGAFAALAAILLVGLLITSGGAGFIYAQF